MSQKHILLVDDEDDIREVETVDGALQNTVIDSFEDVSQFWTYDADEFLEDPTYSREFPECNGC